MNWMRTILDGFAMAAYFNLFAATVALYNPRLMFPSYPPAIIRDAAGTAAKADEPLLSWLLDLFWGAAPLLIYGAVSMVEGGHAGVLADGADRIYPVDDGKPVRPGFFWTSFSSRKRRSAVLSFPVRKGTPAMGSRHG